MQGAGCSCWLACAASDDDFEPCKVSCRIEGERGQVTACGDSECNSLDACAGAARAEVRVGPWYAWGMSAWFDVCGTLALEQIKAMLGADGYREVDGAPRAPGEYVAVHSDAAPGWSDWMYQVEVIELPGKPVADVLARHAALERSQR